MGGGAEEVNSSLWPPCRSMITKETIPVSTIVDAGPDWRSPDPTTLPLL